MLVRSSIAQRIFGDEEILVHAKDLLDITGVTPAPVLGGFAFYHLLLPSHEVIFASGAATESLYLGLSTIESLATNALTDLAKVIGIKQKLGDYKPARVFAKGAKVRRLIERHLRNNRDTCNVGLAAA